MRFSDLFKQRFNNFSYGLARKRPFITAPTSEFSLNEPTHKSSDSKECQTPYTENVIETKTSELDKFLKSHRNSIEKEVQEIFQGSPRKMMVTNQNAKKQKNRLKDVIRNASHFHSITPESSPSTPINVVKATINKKNPTLSCNKHFGGYKEKTLKIHSPIESPAKFSKVTGIGWNKKYQTVRAAKVNSVEVKRKRPRPQLKSTPVNMHTITVDFIRITENRLISATPVH